MKKLFISQPMRGKTADEILEERARAKLEAMNYIADKVEVLDTYFQNGPEHGLLCLAKSLEKLAEADIAYFAKGWQEARGCRIEHECAVRYGIHRIEAEPERRPDKPRLAEILGVEVEEPFSLDCMPPDVVFRIKKEGQFYTVPPEKKGSSYAVMEAINHPSLVKHLPPLTKPEIERCRMYGAKWVCRGSGGKGPIFLCSEKPEMDGDDFPSMKNFEHVLAGVWATGLFPSVRPGDLIEVPEEG